MVLRRKSQWAELPEDGIRRCRNTRVIW